MAALLVFLAVVAGIIAAVVVTSKSSNADDPKVDEKNPGGSDKGSNTITARDQPPAEVRQADMVNPPTAQAPSVVTTPAVAQPAVQPVVVAPPPDAAVAQPAVPPAVVAPPPVVTTPAVAQPAVPPAVVEPPPVVTTPAVAQPAVPPAVVEPPPVVNTPPAVAQPAVPPAVVAPPVIADPGYPISWSAEAADSLRTMDGSAADWDNAVILEWFRSETGSRDNHTMVSVGSPWATLSITSNDRKGVRSPIGQVFRSTGGHSMFGRVVSIVFTYHLGTFLFAATSATPSLRTLQVDTNGRRLTLGLGTATNWDITHIILSTAIAEQRQVLCFLLLEGPTRSLYYRGSGTATPPTSPITFPGHLVSSEPFDTLFIGGNVVNDGEITMHEMVLSSTRDVPPTMEGVNKQYEDLVRKWLTP